MSDVADISIAPRTALWGLVGVMIAADLLLYGHAPGLGFVVLIVVIAAAAQAALGRDVWSAWIVLILALLPAIDVMQFTSFVFALAGLALFCGVLVCGGLRGLGQVVFAALRLPLWGNAQTILDLGQGLQTRPSANLQGLRDWIVPTVLGAVFVVLFAMANPVIDGFLINLWPDNGLRMPETPRLILWGLVAVFAWPMLRLSVLGSRLLRPVTFRPLRRLGILSEGSVLRSLVTFNAIFAIQTVLDLVYLIGGVALPEGIGYAEYAHRGAYPLVVTALLAGGFAVLVQPWVDARPILRWLLLAWVAQNVVLVGSSLARLDLYVEVYGLTRLRFAAFVWMALVVLGLALMIWQIFRNLPVGWMIARALGSGVVALYLTALINVDGWIARHNLTHEGLSFDAWYICQLSEGALPAIRTWEQERGQRLCYSRAPHLSTPGDWREWGYRNARLRHKLAEMEGASA